jgi:hypothetical protein
MHPLARARNDRSAATAGGARRTMASVIPVSSVMSGGIGPDGLISEKNSPVTCPPPIRTAPISIICACSGSQPVVSTSTTRRSRSRPGPLFPGPLFPGPLFPGPLSSASAITLPR